jgi:hypothetical protein
MSYPIWPVVTENLAQQLSAVQGGIVHPAQLIPYLPLSLELVTQALDELTQSDRIQKKTMNGFLAYIFKESLNKPQKTFSPRLCVYSNEPLDDFENAAICNHVRDKIEAELANLASNDVWPAQAVWQHELLYLVANLPAPVSTSSIAGHSRLSLRRVEKYLKLLQTNGTLKVNPALQAWELPPMRYPRAVYIQQDTFIRRFPGAIREEFEVRLVKGLGYSLGILLFSFMLAVIGRIPFPLIFFGGLVCASLVFIKIIKSPPKPIPQI